MSNVIDPNLLRRQREKREADKKAKAAAELAKVQPGANFPLTPENRQKAIEAHIQDLLNKAQDS